MKKTSRRRNIGLLDQYKYNDYDTNKSQDSQSNGEANLDEMKDLNFS